MNRRNLNLNALRAFEAAARHNSFKRAAEELMVTQAAISHHVRQLEEMLGLRLFDRTTRGVELTASGAALWPQITGAFDEITAALDAVAGQRPARVLQVTTTPSFASRWLVQRLGSWHETSGGAIDVHLSPTLRLLDLVRNEADVAIRCGTPPWPGLTAEFLMSVHMTPVCSPGYWQSVRARTPTPADLPATMLLHADVGQNPLGTEWQTWLAAARVPAHRRLPGTSFRDPALSMQAAINGAGIAMGYVELVADDLRSGALVQPFPLAVRHPFSYYAVFQNGRGGEREIAAFVRWLHHEATLEVGNVKSAVGT